MALKHITPEFMNGGTLQADNHPMKPGIEKALERLLTERRSKNSNAKFVELAIGGIRQLTRTICEKDTYESRYKFSSLSFAALVESVAKEHLKGFRIIPIKREFTVNTTSNPAVRSLHPYLRIEWD